MDNFSSFSFGKSYDGSSDPKEFVKAFNLHAAMFGWDDTKKLSVIPHMLSKKAELVYSRINDNDKRNIASVFDALLTGCAQSPENLLSAFNNRSPRLNETISQFGLALQELLNKALPSVGQNEKLSLLKNHLCKYLPEHTRVLIKFNSEKSWEELMACLEDTVPTHSGLSLKFESSGPSQVKLEPSEADVNVTQTKKFSGTCFYCKKPGHKKSDCYKLKSKNSDKPSFKNSSSRSPRPKRKYSPNAKSSSLTKLDLEFDSSDSNSDVNRIEICSSSVDSVANLMSFSSGVELVKRKCKIIFKNSEVKYRVSALFDGGATNSFIRFSKLADVVQKAIVDFKRSPNSNNPYNFKLLKITIRSATDSVPETCVVAPVLIKFGNWSGVHEFIITHSLRDKELILGRDFLKRHKVLIDHGADKILIDKPSLGESTWDSRLEHQACVSLNVVTLAPSTESIVKCKSVGGCSKEVVFAPNANEDGVYWGHSINQINEDGVLYLKVLNLRNEPVVIDANKYVGYTIENFELIDSSREEVDVINVESAKVGSSGIGTSSANEDVESKFKRLRFGEKLKPDQVSQLKSLIASKFAAFQWTEDDIGRTDLIKHKINTGDHKPVNLKQFRIPQAVQGELDKQLNEMLKNKLIEESNSPWCSPVMIVKQVTRDGKIKYRFLADMRGVNEITKKDSFPLPRIDEALDALGGAGYFSTLDMSRGFLQVPLADEDKEKTAFRANNKLYHWTVMPLGLANAPSTFSRLMDMVLHKLTYKYCLVYLDDTIIFSKEFDEHLVYITEILNRIIASKLKLKPEKCVFAADEVNYLGYVVSVDGVKPDKDKVKAIAELPFPKSAKAMTRFLGAVNFYRDFIRDFSAIASPLYKMAQSNEKFKSKLKSLECYEAFEKLKKCLASEPVLSYPDFNRPFYVQADASSTAVGAVIGQMNESKQFRPIMFASRHLTSAETRYSTTERELLAIVFASKKFNSYIYGRHTTFITDHQPLVSMKSLKEPMGRIGRLLNKIQDLDYTLVYQPGSSNFTADLLSRPEKNEINSVGLIFESSVNWVMEQRQDKELSEIIKLVQNKNNEGWKTLNSSDEWSKYKDKLLIMNKILVLVESNIQRIVVPKSVISVVLYMHHDAILAGHRDYEKTKESIKHLYFWINMSKTIKEYCSSCFLCQTKKYINKTNKAPLKPIVVDLPWRVIGIDVVGPLKVTGNGNAYIILIVDYFSKFCIAKAVKDFTVVTTATVVFEEVICKFGMVQMIVSDQGVNFKAKLFQTLCSLCNIKKVYASAYHPAGNGQVERTIKSVKQIITMYINTEHNNWDMCLQPSIAAYNMSVQASTKYSPYEVLFGRKPVRLSDVVLNSPAVLSNSAVSQDDYMIKLKSDAEKVIKTVNENLTESRERQKKYYDRFVKQADFKVDDLVLLINHKSKVGESKSFKSRSTGPYKILEKFNDVNFRIISLKDKQIRVAHFNNLIKFNARDGVDYSISSELESSPNPMAESSRRFQDQKMWLYFLSQIFSKEKESDLSSNDFLLSFQFEAENVRSKEEIRSTFKCDLCEFTSQSQKGMNRHKGRKHKKTSVASDQESNMLDTGLEISSNGVEQLSGQVVCPGCNQSFKGTKGLKQHQRMKSCGQVVVPVGDFS